MIDLDTGKAIVDEPVSEEEDFEEIDLSEVESINVDMDLDATLEKTPETPEEVKEEVVELLGNGDDEAANLAKALDDAFSRLMGGESLLDDIDDHQEESVANEIDTQVENMVESAKDLDLDLSFMKDNNIEGDDSDSLS